MLNEMMHRPVVMAKLVDFMRQNQAAFEGSLGELEAQANQEGIPVIPHETAVFLDFFCAVLQPQHILEIGTAIGFSASLMARHLPKGGQLITIDRYPLMYERAKTHFQAQGLEETITLLEGDAADILPGLEGAFDLIFMDSAKAKYVEFLPHCLRLLGDQGVLIIDDVFQGGTVLDEEATIPKRVRNIHRKLKALFDAVHNDPHLQSSVIPLGDGLLLIRKKNLSDSNEATK